MQNKSPYLQQLLQELQVAEIHAARGKVIVEQQRKRADRLRSTSGPATPATRDADMLLRVVEDTQNLLESHVDLMKREVAGGVVGRGRDEASKMAGLEKAEPPLLHRRG